MIRLSIEDQYLASFCAVHPLRVLGTLSKLAHPVRRVVNTFQFLHEKVIMPGFPSVLSSRQDRMTT